MQPRILVIRGGAIGDFILTLPVLAALRKHFPQARLAVLGYPHIAQLAVAGGLADEVRALEGRQMASFFAAGCPLPAELIEYFGGFSVIVSYLYDPDQVFRINLARCTGAQVITGPHRPEQHPRVHATDAFLKPLERLAIFQADPVPRLTFAKREGVSSSTSAATGSEGAGSRVCLAAHPGSGSEQKNWPEHQWAGLLGELASATSVDLLLVGGESEGDRLPRLAGHWPGNRLAIAQQLGLAELAGRLARCQAFIGHDSGITHLAAAVGLPGLVLWGGSDETVWRPRSPTMRLLRAQAGLQALTLEQVRAESLALLAAKEDAPVG